MAEVRALTTEVDGVSPGAFPPAVELVELTERCRW